MTIAVDMGRKATNKQTNKLLIKVLYDNNNNNDNNNNKHNKLLRKSGAVLTSCFPKLPFSL